MIEYSNLSQKISVEKAISYEIKGYKLPEKYDMICWRFDFIVSFSVFSPWSLFTSPSSSMMTSSSNVTFLSGGVSIFSFLSKFSAGCREWFVFLVVYNFSHKLALKATFCQLLRKNVNKLEICKFSCFSSNELSCA